jgi:exonuclease III
MIYPKLKGFKVGHLNIASLMKHKDELSIFITKNSFDVLCINETRLDSSIYNSEVEIAGYDLIRKDRNRNGGGVAIYVRNVIPYINRTELSPDTVEAICLEIRKPKSKPLLVSTW